MPPNPVRAVDLAAYLLGKLGPLPQMKLHKLLYYCQAWSVVWDKRPIFSDRIEAWTNGPVVPSLWADHRYEYTINEVGGDASKLDSDARDTADVVLTHYGTMSGLELSALTHRERPWQEARVGIASGPSNREITMDMLDRGYARP